MDGVWRFLTIRDSKTMKIEARIAEAKLQAEAAAAQAAAAAEAAAAEAAAAEEAPVEPLRSRPPSRFRLTQAQPKLPGQPLVKGERRW